MTEMAMPTSWDRVEVGDFHREVYTIETGYGHDARGERCQWWRYVVDPLHEERVVSAPFTSILDCRRGAEAACEARTIAPRILGTTGTLVIIDDAPVQLPTSREDANYSSQLINEWMDRKFAGRADALHTRDTADWTTVAPPTEPPWRAFDRYDAAVARTMATAPGDTSALAHWALGLAGEAGEVCEPIKKHAFNGRALDRNALAAELGDVLWYLSALAQSIGSSLGEVAARNVAKLEARYPDGYVPGGGKR